MMEASILLTSAPPSLRLCRRHLPEVQRHYRGDYDIGAAQKANALEQRLSSASLFHPCAAYIKA